ncbi:MAG: hypothetical protein U0840_09585 [Gemmataceae bacterium]
MFCFRLACDCGYESEDACWGEKPWSGHTTVIIPIYNPLMGRICEHEISSTEWAEVGEQTSLWFQKHGASIRDLYGEKATVLIPIEYDKPIMACPKCGRQSCRAIVTGIV